MVEPHSNIFYLWVDYNINSVNYLIDKFEYHLEDYKKDNPLGNFIVKQREIDKNFKDDRFRYKIEIELPKMYRNPCVLAIWSCYENSALEIVNLVQNAVGLKLGVGDIRAHDLLQRLKKYFELVLELKFCSSSDVYQELNKLRIIRNFIAHADGRLNEQSESNISQIEQALEKNDSIELKGNDLVISKKYLYESVELIERALREIRNDIEQKYSMVLW